MSEAQQATSHLLSIWTVQMDRIHCWNIWRYYKLIKANLRWRPLLLFITVGVEHVYLKPQSNCICLIKNINQPQLNLKHMLFFFVSGDRMLYTQISLGRIRRRSTANGCNGFESRHLPRRGETSEKECYSLLSDWSFEGKIRIYSFLYLFIFIAVIELITFTHVYESNKTNPKSEKACEHKNWQGQ